LLDNDSEFGHSHTSQGVDGASWARPPRGLLLARKLRQSKQLVPCYPSGRLAAAELRAATAFKRTIVCPPSGACPSLGTLPRRQVQFAFSQLLAAIVGHLDRIATEPKTRA
jgi:hypothetical protein